MSGVGCGWMCERMIRERGILGVCGDGGSDLDCGSIGVACLWIWSVRGGGSVRVFGNVSDLVRCVRHVERLVGCV